MNEKRYPKNHFFVIGFVIGMSLGVPVAVAMGKIALASCFGLPFGVALGHTLEKNFNKNPLEISETEKKRVRSLSLISLIIGIIVFSISAFFYLT